MATCLNIFVMIIIFEAIPTALVLIHFVVHRYTFQNFLRFGVLFSDQRTQAVETSYIFNPFIPECQNIQVLSSLFSRQLHELSFSKVCLKTHALLILLGFLIWSKFLLDLWYSLPQLLHHLHKPLYKCAVLYYFYRYLLTRYRIEYLDIESKTVMPISCHTYPIRSAVKISIRCNGWTLSLIRHETRLAVTSLMPVRRKFAS